MKYHQIPMVTLVLCLAMMLLSFNANIAISGSFFGKIKVIDLEAYGGLLPSHIVEFKLWRLVVSSLIHAKQLHMLYNLLSLFLLGCLIEKRIGSGYFFLVWVVSGVVGNLAGYYTAPGPWGIGTGGSAANFGLMACLVALYCSGVDRAKLQFYVLVFTLLPALGLDIVYASYHAPKVGHVVPFIVSYGFCYFMFVRRRKISSWQCISESNPRAIKKRV